MRKIGFVLMVLIAAGCLTSFAQIKPCEELKAEIEQKLKDKGVVNFALEIVPADRVEDQKVVGSCDGGKNKITYTKDSPAVQSQDPEEE